MKIEGSLHDLQTRGFVVVRDLLPTELLADAVSEVAERGLSSAAASVVRPGPEATAQIQARVRELFEPIARETDLRLSAIDPLSFYFANPKNVWHTDPPVTYIYQEHYQYVNFWMPIVKPDRNASGMKLVPLDTLRERDRRVYDADPGRGGTFVVPAEIATQGEEAIINWHHDFPGTQRWWPSDGTMDPKERPALCYERDGKLEYVLTEVDLDEMSVTPDVLPGDAILARGDVIHRSDDAQNSRVALAMHAICGETILRKETITGMSKFSRLAVTGPAMTGIMSQVLGAFAFLGKDEIQAKDLLDFMNAVTLAKEPESRAVAAIEPQLKTILFPIWRC